MNRKCSWMNFIPDEQKILPSELKVVELKIGQVCTKNVTIRTNFIPDEQKNLPSELKDVELKVGQVTF